MWYYKHMARRVRSKWLKPKWLKKIHINPDVTTSVPSKAELQVFCGQIENLTWEEFLRYAEYSKDSPHLLWLNRKNREKILKAPLKPKSAPHITIKWSDLMRSAMGVSHQVHVSIHSLQTLAPETLTPQTLKWPELLGQDASNEKKPVNIEQKLMWSEVLEQQASPEEQFRTTEQALAGCLTWEEILAQEV
jgi:hypothetical protein